MVQTRELKKVAIITKKNCEKHLDLIKNLYSYLNKRKKEILLDENSAMVLNKQGGMNKTALLNKADMAIVLGGDGTLLKTARRVSKKKVLVLGVNIGNLGFLTECSKDKMFDSLEKIFEGHYTIDRRTLLRVTIYRGNKKYQTFLGLNDAVINQGAFARLIEIDLTINNRMVGNFKADGLIVSTPTGSTAHSLSADGPIVHPNVEGLVISPICPSSLSMRPIVLPDNRQFTASIVTQRREEETVLGLTIDGQDFFELKYGDRIKFRRSSRYFYLIRTRNKYYKMLRDKLNWGK